MKLEHAIGKIRLIEKSYNEQLNETVEDFNDSLIQEDSLRLIYNDILFFYKQIKKFRLEIKHIEHAKNLLDKCLASYKLESQKIIEHLNTAYNANLNLEEVINQYPKYYYENGIMATLHDYKIIHKVFHKTMMDLIPPHPKDEYPLARKIKRKFIIHVGPTNAGKTYNALQRLRTAKNGVYLAPLRLLAYEIFDTLNSENIPCNLFTGEEEIIYPSACISSSTIEKVNLNEEYDIAVIDEGQLIGDEQRGFAWAKSILGLVANEIHICCAPHSVSLIKKMINDCGDSCDVKTYERQTELIMEKNIVNFPDDIKKGDALIVFSRRSALQAASYLKEFDIKCSIIYGNLPPDTRRKQVDLFISGEHQVLISTNAIAMGLNLPISRVIFLEDQIFDGIRKRPLNVQEVKQIAGRAGRKNIYDKGYVNSLSNSKLIKDHLNQKEDDISCGYILPLDDTIANFPYGSLRERFAAWQSYPLGVSYFQKNDISHIYDLINESAYFEDLLPLSDLLKAINIPFNYKDVHILKLWKNYLQSLVDNEVVFQKPVCPKNMELSFLETYYKQIDLYYSFSKAFKREINVEWVRSERNMVSDKIHELLTSRLQEFNKKCSSCGRDLQWNSTRSICNKCNRSKW